MQLQTHLIGVEAVTRQPSPTHRVLAFLDPLLGGAARKPAASKTDKTRRGSKRMIA